MARLFAWVISCGVWVTLSSDRNNIPRVLACKDVAFLIWGIPGLFSEANVTGVSPSGAPVAITSRLWLVVVSLHTPIYIYIYKKNTKRDLVDIFFCSFPSEGGGRCGYTKKYVGDDTGPFFKASPKLIIVKPIIHRGVNVRCPGSNIHHANVRR